MSGKELEARAGKEAILALITFAIICLLVALLSGCGTTSTVTTYDKDGKIQTIEYVDADIVGSIMQSTKDKSVFVWESGWLFYIKGSPGTYENPTPTLVLLGGKIDKGYASIHKDHLKLNFSGLAKVIEATNKTLTISPQGATEVTK